MGRYFVACNHLVISILAVLMLSIGASAASNQSLVYQGRIIRPDGTVPNSGTITFTLQVYSPTPSRCLLYSENQTVDMTGSQGMFSVAVGSGTRTDGGSHLFGKIFVNGGTISSLTCANGATAYSPGSSDDRNLVVSFNDKGAVVTLSALDIKSVPFALQAAEIGGYGVNDIVKIHPTTGSATTFTTAEMLRAKQLSGAACASNEILKWNGTAWACAPDATGSAPGNAGYTSANKGTVAFDVDAATSGITVTSGVAKLSDVNSNIGSFGGAAKAVSFTVNAQGRVTAASEVNIALPVGQLTQSGATTGQVLKWDGSNWAPAADVGVTADASYAAKGVVRFDTDAATSGIEVASGIAKLNTGTGANQIVKLDGTGKLPTLDGSALTNLSAASLDAGVLPVARGGTNNGSLGVTAGGILYMDGSKAMTTAAGTSGQALISNGTAAPGFGTLGFAGGGTGATSFTANSLIMANAGGTALTSKTCANNEILKWNGTTWACATDATGTSPGDASFAAKGLIQGLTDESTSGLKIASGVISVNAGTGANQIVKLDGTGKFPALDGSALTNVTANGYSGVLPVANGGTNSSTALNNDRIMVSAGGKIVEAAAMNDGQILIGDTGGAPVVATVGQSNGISITAGAGSLSIATNATSANTASTIVSRDASGNFAAGAVTNTSNILKGATSGAITMTVPGTVTPYTLTWPAAVGGAGSFLTTDASGNLSWGSPAAIADSSYAAKGAVQFLTDASTSGIAISSGVASVNAGTGANQIVKLNGSSQLPAVDGSLLTNLSAANIASGVLPIARGGTNNGSLGVTAGGILYMDGSKAMTTAAGTSGQALLSAGAGAPAFGNLGVGAGGTGTTAFAANSLVMANGTGSALTNITCSLGEILKWNGTSWGCVAGASAIADAAYTSANKGVVAFDTDASTSGVSVTSGVAKINTGTGANQIVKLNGSSQLPAVDGSLLTNLSASQISSGTLPIARGGTNSGTALNNNRLMISSGGAIVEAPAMTNGQIIVGSTGAAPAVATLGQSNGISITTGAGTLSIATNATSANTASTIVSRDASGNFSAGQGSFSSFIMRGATSGTLTINVPTTVTDYSIRWPSAVGSAGSFLTTDASGNLSWGSPAAISDSSYSVKGAVQFDTDAATSGVSVTTGVAKVNVGTSANQIVKLNGSAQLPAVDGSLLTNLSAGNIASGVLPIARGGTNNGSLGVTAGGMLYADGSKLMTTAAGTSGQAMISSGAGAPAFGTLGFAGGGTGATSFTAHGLILANAGGTALTSKTCANNEILKWDGTTWACAVDATGTSPGDASYTAKGLVQGLTNAATSGLNIASGVISVNAGTGANQIVKLDGSSKLPAVDGSALTNLTASNLTGVVPAANGGTGQSSYTAGDLLYASGPSAISKLGIGGNGSILTSNGSAPTWTSLSSLGFILDGGNTVTATATVGTNSNHNLAFETNGTTKMTILSDGKVGIGTATPTNFFEVDGGVATTAGGGLGILLQGQAASGLSYHYGGAVTLRGGKGYGNDGAGAEVIAGGGTDVQGGGSVTLKAGNGNSNASPGQVYIEAGTTANNGGGHVNITSGLGGGNKSGNVYIATGSGATLGDILLGINSAGNIRGNVGIGVTSASSALDLNGSWTQRGMTAPTVSSAGQGRIYFDSTANKFKVSQNGAAYVDLVSSGTTADASYSSKGLVQGLTDAATSGLNIASGVISVNAGTGANQIVKLNGSSQLPAVDGSALTNLNAGNIASGTLPVARGGTNATSFAANRLVGTNGTGAALQAVTCSQNQVISFDASGNYGCYNVGSIFSGFVDGGNSFAATATLGTNDAQSLVLESNNTPRLVLEAGGHIGFNVADPMYPLHAVGSSRFDGEMILESESAGGPSRFVISANNVQNDGPPAIYFAAKDNYTHPVATEELGVLTFINGVDWNTGAMIKAEAAENFSATAVGTSLKFYTTPKGTTNLSERLVIDSEGVMTIGSQLDRTVASDRGQLAFETTYLQTANVNTTVNWNLGNVQELNTFVCNGSKTITMTNLKDGGSYSLLISGAGAHSGTCLFAASGKTFKTAGGATAPTASRDILFSFQVINNTVVYSMSDNLQ